MNDIVRFSLSLSLSHSVFILFLFNLRLVPLALKHRIVRAFSVLLSRTVFSCSSSFSMPPSFSVWHRLFLLRANDRVSLPFDSTRRSFSSKFLRPRRRSPSDSFRSSRRIVRSSPLLAVTSLSPFLSPRQHRSPFPTLCIHVGPYSLSVHLPLSPSPFLFSFRG